MYTNLLYFLSAIFLFTVSAVPETPLLPAWGAVGLFVLSLAVYERLVWLLHEKTAARSAAGYFRAERRASFLALLVFSLTTYFCDVKYYLSVLPGAAAFPSAVNIAGLLLFFLYLSLMWRGAVAGYQRVFGREYTVSAFIVSNVRVNLPIILPWAVLSFCYDLASLLVGPEFHDFLFSTWGDFLLTILFFGFVLLVFPPLVLRLWGCKPMPSGLLKGQLTAFCARQKFSAQLYLWPLFEGRALTAGVMGLVPGLRYILITPGLIEALSPLELEAVMAHEIGHVKKKHLLLYMLLLAGFSLVTGVVAEPLTYFLLSRDLFYVVLRWWGASPEAVLAVCAAVLLFGLMLLYFRFLFGYFIRNFERQADLQVFAALGDSRALVSAFEKIAVVGGGIRDQPSWHHFSIAERVAFLEKCEREPLAKHQHERKVRFSLIVYLLGLTVLVGGAHYLPVEGIARQYEEKYLEAVVLQKVRQEPDKALWLQWAGDLMQQKKMEKKALDAYERALTYEPVTAELMNNLAWLLLTCDDPQLRDPQRALMLARSAVEARQPGSFLDTLALALWANGLVDEAVAAEEQAILADPAGQGYYQQQVARFRRTRYSHSLEKDSGK